MSKPGLRFGLSGSPVLSHAIWGFPKIRGTFFGGPYDKDHSILESILGSPNFGKLPNEGPPFKASLLVKPDENVKSEWGYMGTNCLATFLPSGTCKSKSCR